MAGAAAGAVHSTVQRHEAYINERLSAVNAQAGNTVRGAKNAAIAAQNTLARYVQSVNNNRALTAGGEALEANAVNARRQGDVALQQSFATNIQQAEQEGAARAAQSAAGADGAVVDQINGAMRLRDEMINQGFADRMDTVNSDTARRAGNIMTQMVGGLDSSMILDTFDWGVDVAKKFASYSAWAGAVRGLGQSMGAGGSINAGMGGGSGETTKASFKSESDGLATRERSSSAYDLADHSYDTQTKFGYKSESSQDPYSPYTLSGTGVKFGGE
jgi:hypothetical protein